MHDQHARFVEPNRFQVAQRGIGSHVLEGVMKCRDAHSQTLGHARHIERFFVIGMHTTKSGMDLSDWTIAVEHCKKRPPLRTPPCVEGNLAYDARTEYCRIERVS